MIKKNLLLLFIGVMYTSCSQEDINYPEHELSSNPLVTKAEQIVDINALDISAMEPIHLETEEEWNKVFNDFIEKYIPDNNLNSNNIYSSMASIPIQTLYGYDYINYSGYTKYTYGSWCEKYGLSVGTIYLERIATANKYIPCTSNDVVTEGVYSDMPSTTPMGYIPGMLIDENYVKGFKIGSYAQGRRIASSFVRHTHYDISGRLIDVYHPFIPSSLTWKYKIVDMGGW